MATKVLLIVGLLVLLGCAPQATPTPTTDLQATIEALRAEPTPMVVVIATSTPTGHTYQYSYTYAYTDSNFYTLAVVCRKVRDNLGGFRHFRYPEGGY